MISLARLKNLIRWVKTTLPEKAGAAMPINQVEYMSKVAESVMWFPYGMHANVPADALALMLSVQANEESRVALPGSPIERPTDLQPGEVAFFHPMLGTMTLVLRNTGVLEINTPTSVAITSPAVTMSGTLDVTGTITGGTVLTTAGRNLDMHVHVGSPTAPTGAISNTGAPV